MTEATRAKWTERVREWRASGRSAEEFATGLDFEASTLRYWSSRLKSDAAAKSAPPMARVVRRRRAADAVDLVAPSLSAEAEVVVVVGRARVVVRRGFDAELLREVTTALGSVR